MLFFSGFSLRDEEVFFSDYLSYSELCVSGFSYGAIKAFNYTLEQVKIGKRVDRLQLLSPAFFQTKSEKFKRMQLISYTKNEDKYMKGFLDGCFYPYEKKQLQQIETKKDELDELLYYIWDSKEFEYILDKGVKVEVYLGAKDSIIDIESAREFFLHLASVTYIKDANHFLQTN